MEDGGWRRVRRDGVAQEELHCQTASMRGGVDFLFHFRSHMVSPHSNGKNSKSTLSPSACGGVAQRWGS